MLNLPNYSQVKPIIKDVIGAHGIHALDPNVAVKLPSTITFGCR